MLPGRTTCGCLRTYVHKKGGRATVTAPPPPRPGRPPAGARRPAAALRRARRRRVVARSATHPVRPPRAPGSQRTTAVKTLPPPAPANDQQQADARADGEWTADAVRGLRRIVRPDQKCNRPPREASIRRAHTQPKRPRAEPQDPQPRPSGWQTERPRDRQGQAGNAQGGAPGLADGVT